MKGFYSLSQGVGEEVFSKEGVLFVDALLAIDPCPRQEQTVRGSTHSRNLNITPSDGVYPHRAHQLQAIVKGLELLRERKVKEVIFPVQWYWFEPGRFYINVKGDWCQEETLSDEEPEVIKPEDEGSF